MDEEQRQEIVRAYGKVLSRRRLTVGRVGDLPCPKDKIREALRASLQESDDPKIANALQVGYVELETFVPDLEYETVQRAQSQLGDQKIRPDDLDPDLISDMQAYLNLQAEIVERQRERLEEFTRLLHPSDGKIPDDEEDPAQ